jgi:2-polyprenyl-6-hydroxyphenyl methylase/3-demethylubiquinone-9 3-methyltransferase
MTALAKDGDHFAFGENWASYAASVGDAQIAEARDALATFLGLASLAGMSFLDIGSGSGIHSLAALQLGARRVMALDVDAESVATTQAMLRRHAPSGADYEVRRMSILAPDLMAGDVFDIVYSWGVLHHTGQMRDAMVQAAGLVRQGGLFAFALYGRTRLCRFWKTEKRFYSGAPTWVQSAIHAAFVTLLRLRLSIGGRSFTAYVADYSKQRGMDFYHDAHDWLGGWPYESIDPRDVETLLASLGFTKLHSNVQQQKLGLFGSGCNEYLYRRL